MPHTSYFKLESNKYKKCNTPEEKFDLLSRKLLKNFKLMVGDEKYSIEEVEVYYYSNDHKDEYVHKNKDQLKNAKWYFHQYGIGVYKSGTYKGLDMTFGNDVDKYGGILIRSIMNINTNEFITGPCNCVNHMLKKFNLTESGEMVNRLEDLDIFNTNNTLHLIYEKNEIIPTIFTGPRVGLSLKYPNYLLKEYRYLKQPTKIPKYRSTIITTLYKNGETEKTIETKTKLSSKTIKNSIQEFNNGKIMTEVDAKELGVDKINLIYGYNSR